MLVTVSITGENYSRTFSPEVVNTLWAKPEKVSTEGFLDCPLPYFWVSDYYLPLGNLEPGTYKTIHTIDPQHPLKDGLANVCSWSDGTPITEYPALYRTTDIYTNTYQVR